MNETALVSTAVPAPPLNLTHRRKQLLTALADPKFPSIRQAALSIGMHRNVAYEMLAVPGMAHEVSTKQDTQWDKARRALNKMIGAVDRASNLMDTNTFTINDLPILVATAEKLASLLEKMGEPQESPVNHSELHRRRKLAAVHYLLCGMDRPAKAARLLLQLGYAPQDVVVATEHEAPTKP